MYKNLVEILKRKGITIKAYAELLGISEKSAQNKIYARTEFTLGEALKTCALMPEYKMEYLIKLQGAPIFVGKVYVIDDKTHSTMLKAEEY